MMALCIQCGGTEFVPCPDWPGSEECLTCGVVLAAGWRERSFAVVRHPCLQEDEGLEKELVRFHTEEQAMAFIADFIADGYFKRSCFEIRRLALALPLLLVAAPASAQRTHVEIRDQDSRGKGYAIIDQQRGTIDSYDKDSRRTGLTTIRPDGRVDVYTNDSRRGARHGKGKR